MLNGRILVYLRAPVLSQSGYGAHAREVMDYFLADEKFLVALESINWGNCGYINEKTFNDPTKIKKYYESIMVWEQVRGKHQFDLGVHVSIPNEFSRTGKINIGITAGLEVDRIPHHWVRKCNEMDIIVVPSQHSANIFHRTTFKAINPQTGESIIERIQKPIYIIPEYAEKPSEIKPLNLEFSTEKNLLCVGLWGGKGGFGEDRKNIADLIKLFLIQNKDDPNVGLILKTQIVNGSSRDKAATIKRIDEIKKNFGNDEIKCKIHLIHQELTDEQMWSLYSHPQVTGVISLTHGEGFGRPLLEAAVCGKPVLATNWSGHLDFLKKENGFIPLEYEMAKIPECQIWENVITEDSQWAKVNDQNVLKRMKKFLDSPKPIQRRAEKGAEWVAKTFGKESVWNQWSDFYAQFIKEVKPEDDIQTTPENYEYELRKKDLIEKLSEGVDLKSEKKKALYIIPQSAGDCLISTSIINSLILNRHLEAEWDFYVATTPPYQDLFSKLESKHGVKVLDYNHELMFNSELTREVWDVVYSPGINVQFTFSNWLLGNGDYSVRLLEEFAKNCNLHPGELRNYKVDVKPCKLPESAYIVVGPGGQKSAKSYKYWPDVISNIKQMLPNVEVVQVGALDEDLLDGVLDYRGKTFAESFYVIQNAFLLVGCDSFPGHAAAAMDTPHLIIFGSTHASTCSPVTFNKKLRQLAIETDECSPKCYKNSCMKERFGKNCLSYIEPSSICSSIKFMAEKILEDKKEKENDNK